MNTSGKIDQDQREETEETNTTYECKAEILHTEDIKIKHY